jgi:hypothetical protein
MTFRELYKKDNESIKPDSLLLSQIADKMREARSTPQVRPLYTRRRMMYMVSAVAAVVVLAVAIPVALNLGGRDLPTSENASKTADGGYAGEFAAEETTAAAAMTEAIMADEAAGALPDLMPEGIPDLAEDEAVYTVAATAETAAPAEENGDGAEVLFAVQETTEMASTTVPLTTTAAPETNPPAAATNPPVTTTAPPVTTESATTAANTQTEETGVNDDALQEADEEIVGAPGEYDNDDYAVEYEEEGEELIEEEAPVDQEMPVDSGDTEEDSVEDESPASGAAKLPEQKTLGGIMSYFTPQGYDVFAASVTINTFQYNSQTYDLNPADYYIFNEIISINVNQPVVKDEFPWLSTQMTSFVILPKTARLGEYLFLDFYPECVRIHSAQYEGEYVVKLATGSIERINAMRRFVATYPEMSDIKTFGDFKNAFLSEPVHASEYGWVPASPAQDPNYYVDSFNDMVLINAISMIPSDAAFTPDNTHIHGNMGEYTEFQVQTYFPYSNQSVMYDMHIYFFADGMVRFEVTNFNYTPSQPETADRYAFTVKVDTGIFNTLRMAIVGF